MPGEKDPLTYPGTLNLNKLSPEKRLEIDGIRRASADIGKALYRLWRICDCSKAAFTQRLKHINPELTYAEAFDLMDYWMEQGKP